jgi:hypothetical protein
VLEDGTKEWYENHELHRLDGPAIEHADGSKEWYLNGRSVSEEEVRKTYSLERLTDMKLDAPEKVTF